MGEQIEKGKYCSLEQLIKEGYQKKDHGIGEDEIWFLNNGHSTYLFINLFTRIVDNIVINYN